MHYNMDPGPTGPWTGHTVRHTAVLHTSRAGCAHTSWVMRHGPTHMAHAMSHSPYTIVHTAVECRTRILSLVCRRALRLPDFSRPEEAYPTKQSVPGGVSFAAYMYARPAEEVDDHKPNETSKARVADRRQLSKDIMPICDYCNQDTSRTALGLSGNRSDK